METTLPPNWTVHSLPPMDCFIEYRDVIVVSAWLVSGWVDHSKLKESLNVVITAHAPWFGGRLVTKNDSEISRMLEIHVPPASDTSTPSFSFSAAAYPSQSLSSVVPHVRAGTSDASVHVTPSKDYKVLSPWASANDGMERFTKSDTPMIHLHIGECQDGSIISLSTSHVLMDATSLSIFVQAWQLALNGTPESITPLQEAAFDYAPLVAKSKISHTSYLAAIFRGLFLALMGLYLAYDAFRHRTSPGFIYIPDAVIRQWVTEINEKYKETVNGKKITVSRNDVLLAWLYKNIMSVYSPKRHATMCILYSFRGRHPAFPSQCRGNAIGSTFIDSPGIPISTLLSKSVGDVAFDIRRFVNSLSSDSVEASLEMGLEMLHTGSTIIPIIPQPADTRFVAVNSWINLGVGLDFSSCLVPNSTNHGETAVETEGIGETISVAPITLDRSHVLTVVEDKANGLVIHGRLPLVCWEILKEQLNKGDV